MTVTTRLIDGSVKKVAFPSSDLPDLLVQEVAPRTYKVYAAGDAKEGAELDVARLFLFVGYTDCWECGRWFTLEEAAANGGLFEWHYCGCQE